VTEKSDSKNASTGGPAATAKGPKHTIDIEGVGYPWHKDTITVPELRALGGIPDDQQIVEVFDDNSEQTLAEDAVIAVKPGKGFGKKVKFQRG